MANEETLACRDEGNLVGSAKSIYIIRNNINNKVYIGQSVNPDHRFLEHKQESLKNKPETAIAKAIKKYGEENFYIGILENDILDYNKKEQYWIWFFNSIAPNGYNLSRGGENPPIRYGEANNMSKITEEIAKKIKNSLKELNLSIKDIAECFNVSVGTVKNINKGVSWRSGEENYPIRKSNTKLFRVAGESAIFAILEELKTGNMTYRKMEEKYGISRHVIAKINYGHYSSVLPDDISYPIREKTATSEMSIETRKRSKVLLPEIYKRLEKGESYKKIAKDLGFKNTVIISRINNGTTFREEGKSYPIRKRVYKISEEDVKKITFLLADTNRSIVSISKEFDIPITTIIRLKNGTIKAYRLPSYAYPLR